MKSLKALVIFQTTILLLLSVRVVTQENESAAEQPNSLTTISAQPSIAAEVVAHTASGLFDEDRLREIIRDELAVHRDEIAVVDGTVDSAPVMESGRAYERSLEPVQQTVDYYISTGSISDQEMANLQQDIARLNPADRTAMLMEIVRAVNNGQLDGRL